MKKQLKNYLIPHEANEYKPHSLQNKNVLAILLLLGIFEAFFLASIFTPFGSFIKNNFAAVLPSVLVMATNETRADLALDQLQTNPTLQYAAQLKADDMAARSFFSHVNPDGQQPWIYLQQAGYSYRAAGENLAVNFIDSKDVHKAWMKSPTHKANIVESQFTEIGIATARGTYQGEDVVFVVQFFAVPKPAVQNTIASNNSYVAVATEEEAEKLEIELAEADLAAVQEEAGTANEVAVEDFSAQNAQVLGANEVVEDEEDEVVAVATTTDEVGVIESVTQSPYRIVAKLSYLLLGLVSVMLLLKIFIKPSVQHKRLIMNGLLVVIAIIFVMTINIVIKSQFGAII